MFQRCIFLTSLSLGKHCRMFVERFAFTSLCFYGIETGFQGGGRMFSNPPRNRFLGGLEFFYPSLETGFFPHENGTTQRQNVLQTSYNVSLDLMKSKNTTLKSLGKAQFC